MEWQVPAPLVDPHDADAAVEQPIGRGCRHPGASLPIGFSADKLVAAGADEHDAILDQVCSSPGECCLHVMDSDWIIVGLVRHVQNDARTDAALKWNFVDGLCRPTARGRSIVPRRIYVRRRMY